MHAVCALQRRRMAGANIKISDYKDSTDTIPPEAVLTAQQLITGRYRIVSNVCTTVKPVYRLAYITHTSCWHGFVNTLQLSKHQD